MATKFIRETRPNLERIITMRFSAEQLDTLDRIKKRLKLTSRTDVIRTMMDHYLEHHPDSDRK